MIKRLGVHRRVNHIGCFCLIILTIVREAKRKQQLEKLEFSFCLKFRYYFLVSLVCLFDCIVP